MAQSNYVKIVVFVPETHADAVRKAFFEAHAGEVGNYSQCSFSSKGIGRFKPEKGAHPAIGSVGKLEAVPEERIETICPRKILNSVIEAIKKAHPYEEVAFDIYPLEKI
jgi:hypothetical protein